MPLYSVYQSQIKQAADHVLKIMGTKAEISIILGSGLSSYADKAFKNGRSEIKYADIPGLPRTNVEGHRGTLYYGTISGKMCVCFAGRFHSYEGHSPEILTLLPQLSYALGCRYYIMTNAAGGTLSGMKTGCLMSIKEHASTLRFNPLSGFEAINSKDIKLTSQDYKNQIKEINYPFKTSSKEIYSKKLMEMAQKISEDPQFIKDTQFKLKGEDRQVALHQGIYVCNGGPNYESLSETRTLMSHVQGTLGMSSVPEALCARMLGMDVYGMSLVTNLASGLSDEILTHEDVQTVATEISTSVEALISKLIDGIDQTKVPPPAPWGNPTVDFEMVIKQSAYTQPEAVDAFLGQLTGKPTRIIIYPNPKYRMYEDGNIIFVAAPKQLNNFHVSLMFKVAAALNITDIKYLVPSLPAGTEISGQNVINYTGTFVYQNIRSGTKLAPKSGDKLMVWDMIEDPQTSDFCTSVAKRLNAKFLTTDASAIPGVMGTQVGINVTYCSADKLDAPANGQINKDFCFPSERPKIQLFETTFISDKCPKYQEDVAVLQKLQIEKVIVSDSMNFIKRGERVHVSFLAYYSAQHKALYVHLPQAIKNHDVFEAAYPIRCLAPFEKKIKILILTDNTNVKNAMIVDDIINITYINPLRGENCNKFGPRFIDLSQTCNKDLSKELEQKGGYKRGVFHVNIELKNDNNVLEREIFSGSMLCLLAACHQGHIVVGMAAPDGKAMCAIEKTWIGDSAEACCESTCCCSCKK